MFKSLLSKSRQASEYSLLSEDDLRQPSESPSRKLSEPSVLVWKTVALCEFCIILILVILSAKDGNVPRLPYSLVGNLIKYETRVFHNSVGRDLSPYQGPPSPELDALWSNIYKGAIFKISKEEASLLPNKTSAIPDDPEGAYISSLAVFHHLHCINFIRKTLYPEYYPDMDLKNATILEHTEHCIDILRQAHMCTPDTTAAIWQWHPSIQKSIPTWDIQHTCVKYDDIQAWAMSRALYEYDGSIWVEGNPIHD